MSSSREGQAPGCGAEKSEKKAEVAGAFGGEARLEAEITGNTESEDEEDRERERKHAQGEKKTGGSGGGFRLRKTDGGFGRAEDKKSEDRVQNKEGGAAQAQKAQWIRQNHD
jgi:hypothetical protein